MKTDIQEPTTAAPPAEQLGSLEKDLTAFLKGLGPDVRRTDTLHYRAFRRLNGRNFTCVEMKPRAGYLRLSVDLDPSEAELVPGFTRDLSDLGHLGTGDLEIRVGSKGDLRRAQPLLRRAYKRQESLLSEG